MDTEKTKVIFRKFKGEIIAFFPEIEVNPDNFGHNMMSYAHVGQHSEASLYFYYDCTPAKPHEYADLKAELESIGYNLDVRIRRLTGRR